MSAEYFQLPNRCPERALIPERLHPTVGELRHVAVEQAEASSTSTTLWNVTGKDSTRVNEGSGERSEKTRRHQVASCLSMFGVSG